MRAMMSETPGGPESLKLMEMPSKPLGKGQVRVAVKAAGVNFPDTLIIADKYQFKPPRPFAPGHEVAGDITEVGEGVSAYKVGQRVIGMIGHGGYATEVVADQGQLLPMPDNMSYEDGAAFTMTYGTSYYALKQRSDIKPGETLLVTGASGGVGLTAVELGALMGLKVIAAVGSDEKMEVCRKYGATMFVNYAKEKMRDKVKELTGGVGADIIYDAVGGDAFDELIRCIAWYGRLLVVGFAAGRIPQLPANLALLKSCDVRGVFYGAWRGREPDEARKNFDELLTWYGEGKLKPPHFHALPAGEGRRRHERAALAQGDGQGRPDSSVSPAMIGRRRLTAFLGASIVPWGARADDFPIKPITLVVPFTPGGAIDMLARLVAQQASATLGRADRDRQPQQCRRADRRGIGRQGRAPTATRC